ncbi:FGGY-family carbohydrate kinase, partial [Aerococcus sp. L_32]
STNEDEVYLVPAFTGLGAPYWDSDARGAAFGITRGTTKADFAKATLQSIAYQVRDITDTMNKDTGIDIPLLKVDGGAAMNGYLMQFQSDITGIEIARAANLETTALGAAYLAGLAVGYWKDIDELKSFTQPGQTFEPKMNDSHKEDLYAGWTNAVRATRAYSQYFKEEAND